MIPDLQDQIKAATEEAVALSQLPRRELDVGRYPVVFDGATFGAALGYTLGQACEMDRVLGYEADASGTSFLAPANEFLGAQAFSPLLTVTADRNVPDAAAVRWDDEGVVPDSFTLVKDGRLMDYQTSRQTASVLKDWYHSQHAPVRSHGGAVASNADDPIMVRTSHVSVAPSARKTSLEDLCRDMRHGILVRQGNYCTTDQQLSSASMNFALMLEIERGKIVRRIKGAALQFSALSFWKALNAVGDASTLLKSEFSTYKGQPWKSASQSATAPAGFFKEINVISIGRRL
jgi:TldD protein